MTRIIKVLALAAITAAISHSAAFGADRVMWDRYKADFITPDGRVIDFYQDQASHSEGQGYGMTLAAAFGDRKTFDKLWAWTKANLGGRPDGLFVWLWGKRLDGRWEIIDFNNATDGDILIAYALLKAHAAWGEASYKNDAQAIIRAIRKSLSAQWKGQTVILPSYYGFTGKNEIVLNPSYLIIPAFRAFAKEDDHAFWEKARHDSFGLISKSLLGEKALPADWVKITDDGFRLHYDRSVKFGYDAVRVILHLAADDPKALPSGVNEMFKFYEGLGYIPAWVDLDKDAFSMSSASGGAYSIYALAAQKTGKKALGEKLFAEARRKLDYEKKSYYSWSLFLIVNSGAFESGK
ncbi:MAG: endoglucanase [Nitrospinae bacterium]|nr:endoglucanase [Nitrospinota bacterium]